MKNVNQFNHGVLISIFVHEFFSVPDNSREIIHFNCDSKALEVLNFFEGRTTVKGEEKYYDFVIENIILELHVLNHWPWDEYNLYSKYLKNIITNFTSYIHNSVSILNEFEFIPYDHQICPYLHSYQLHCMKSFFLLLLENTNERFHKYIERSIVIETFTPYNIYEAFENYAGHDHDIYIDWVYKVGDNYRTPFKCEVYNKLMILIDYLSNLTTKDFKLNLYLYYSKKRNASQTLGILDYLCNDSTYYCMLSVIRYYNYDLNNPHHLVLTYEQVREYKLGRRKIEMPLNLFSHKPQLISDLSGDFLNTEHFRLVAETTSLSYKYINISEKHVYFLDDMFQFDLALVYYLNERPKDDISFIIKNYDVYRSIFMERIDSSKNKNTYIELIEDLTRLSIDV